MMLMRLLKRFRVVDLRIFIVGVFWVIVGEKNVQRWFIVVEIGINFFIEFLFENLFQSLYFIGLEVFGVFVEGVRNKRDEIV